MAALPDPVAGLPDPLLEEVEAAAPLSDPLLEWLDDLRPPWRSGRSASWERSEASRSRKKTTICRSFGLRPSGDGEGVAQASGEQKLVAGGGDAILGVGFS
jgi:hypothetical protein